MTQVGAPQHDPIPIGEVAQPPFVRLPDPATLFARRAARLQFARRAATSCAPISLFLADAERRPAPPPGRACRCPNAADAGRDGARAAIRHAAARPPAFHGATPPSTRACDRLLALAGGIEMPESARLALARVNGSRPAARDGDGRAPCCRTRSRSRRWPSMLSSPPPAGAFRPARSAARRRQRWSRSARAPVRPAAVRRCIDGGRLARCARRALLCLLAVRHAVELRARQMHAVRLDQGHRLPGDRRRAGHCQGRDLRDCRGYVKILHQQKDPALDPVADDVATPWRSICCCAKSGYRRGAVNPFLLGY